MIRLGTIENVEKVVAEWESLGVKAKRTRESVKIFAGPKEVFWALKKDHTVWICWYNDKFYRTIPS